MRHAPNYSQSDTQLAKHGPCTTFYRIWHQKHTAAKLDNASVIENEPAHRLSAAYRFYVRKRCHSEMTLHMAQFQLTSSTLRRNQRFRSRMRYITILTASCLHRVSSNSGDVKIATCGCLRPVACSADAECHAANNGTAQAEACLFRTWHHLFSLRPLAAVSFLHIHAASNR